MLHNSKLVWYSVTTDLIAVEYQLPDDEQYMNADQRFKYLALRLLAKEYNTVVTVRMELALDGAVAFRCL